MSPDAPTRERRRSERRDPIAELERTLPHNLEAEQAVLGAVLLHNEAYPIATRHIGAADFFRDAHRRLFTAVATLLEQPNATVDYISLKNELARSGDLDEVGGPSYISKLTDGVPRSTNVAEYARIVREKSLLRQLIYTGNKMITEAYSAEDPAAEILNAADQAIVQLQHGTRSGRMRALSSSSHDMLERLEYRHTHQGELSGVDTGFTSINENTMGWQSGDMIIVAARPSIGKTAFVLNTVSACALSQRLDGTRRSVAVFSLEMKRPQLEDRLLASLSGVPLTAIMRGWLYDPHWSPISQAVGQMGEMNIHIDDAASRTVGDIRAECRRIRSEHGLDLVVIDYVQLMTGTLQRKGATRNEEITDISRKIKILSDEISAPIIVCSQLKRTGGGRPGLEDLRESGSLEQDADLVAFLHRKDHRESGTTNFIIAKQRNGATGTVNLTFDRDIQRFTDGGEETPEQHQQAKVEDDQHAKVRNIIRNRAKKR